MNAEKGQDWRTRFVVVGLLAAAQVAFPTVFSPLRALSCPHRTLLTLQGAILVHPFLLYPMWAALSRGGLAWRLPLASLLSAAVVYVDFGGFTLKTVTLSLVAFALAAMGFWLIRRALGWQIVPFDAKPTSRKGLPFRFQYRLRHLLEGMLLAACVLSAFRVFFPQGITFPHGVIGRWNRVGGEISDFATALAILLPPAVVPWAVLIRHARRTWAVLLAAICWPTLDYGLFLFMRWKNLPPGTTSSSELRDIFLFVQFGASLAALTSALVFRWLGYRMVRAESEKVAPTGDDAGQ